LGGRGEKINEEIRRRFGQFRILPTAKSLPLKREARRDFKKAPQRDPPFPPFLICTAGCVKNGRLAELERSGP
jgi:hypothetical protein